MRILMALSQLEVTGAEVYGVTLSDELIKRNHEVYIASDTLTKETKAKYLKVELSKRRKLSDKYKRVKELIHIIKEYKIDVIHSHSRAASWSASIASKITGVPLVVTVHGRLPVHTSSKLNKSLGNFTIPVCENIYNHIVKDFGVDKSMCKIIRNPVDIEKYKVEDRYVEDPSTEESVEACQYSPKKIISIIGRLSGPKGDVAFELLHHLTEYDKYIVNVVGGSVIPDRFLMYKDRVNFLGYIDDVPKVIRESDLVIGAGRVGVEALLMERALFAIGEAESIGFVTKENLSFALASNFGDIGVSKNILYDFAELKDIVPKIEEYYKNKSSIKEIREIILEEFEKNRVVDKIEEIYRKFVK